MPDDARWKCMSCECDIEDDPFAHGLDEDDDERHVCDDCWSNVPTSSRIWMRLAFRYIRLPPSEVSKFNLFGDN